MVILRIRLVTNIIKKNAEVGEKGTTATVASF